MTNAGESEAQQRVVDLERALDELRSYEEIRRVLFLYARAADRCDADQLRDVYHSDATDIHGTAFAGRGRDLADWLIGWASKLPFNRHTVTNVIIELDGDRAFVESQYDATHRFPLHEGGAIDRRSQGRYLDVFERRDGVWRILHRRMVSDGSWTRVLSPEALTGAADPQRTPAPAALASGHAPNDPVYRGFAIADIVAEPYQARDPSEAVRERYGPGPA